MTRTTAADYPTLGFDPTPGDTYEVSTLATTLSGVSNAMNEISNVLHGAADGDWRGQAAVAFRDLLDDDLRPKIDKSCEAFGDAYHHISTWSTSLSGYQGRARTLEHDALLAQQRAAAAQTALNGLPDAPDPNEPPPDDPAEKKKQQENGASRTRNEKNLATANGEVEGYRKDARDLADEYKAKGADIAKLLKHSIDIAPNEPGWLDSLMDSLGDFFDGIGDWISDLGDKLTDFLKSIAPLLEIIGDLAGLLSTVLGLLAFIPGLQWLAIPALILGGVALLAHYGAAVGRTGSFLEAMKDPGVILDAVSLALGGGAFALGSKLTSVARAGGNVRSVPQLLIGGSREIPYGFFSIAKGLVPTMETNEFIVRTIGLKVTYGGFAATGAGAGDNVNTIRQIFTGFGPMDDRNSDVTVTSVKDAT